MSTLSNAALRSNARNVVTSKLLGSTRGMAAGKEIRFGVEGRAAMLRGVDLLADAVQVRDEVSNGHKLYLRFCCFEQDKYA